MQVDQQRLQQGGERMRQIFNSNLLAYSERSKRLSSRRRFTTYVAVLILVVLGLMLANVSAHNAGHIHLPTGECVNVGSAKHGPTVNPAAPNIKNADGTHTLDLIPGSGDQYGARYAATQGKTPIEARHCHEPGAHNHP